MSRGLVNCAVTGADRIVKDAVINKIGTYSIAVLAHEHQIPYYAAAPLSTFDLSHVAENITIEERSSEEITKVGSKIIAPLGTKTLNPAFDVTPMKYVTAVICEKGVLTPQQLRQLI
jgi:methylthioribose-1-phosphate isomerase